MDYTSDLTKFSTNLKKEDLPENVISQTKLVILDYFASSFAGFRLNRYFNESLLNMIELFGGNEQASILCSTDKTSVDNAAFINAIYAHGADLDDGNKQSAGHIATSVIPSVFALSEWKQKEWSDVFLAINVGYEVFNRLASAAQPSLYQKGFHSTGVAGSVASAAASAKILNLNSKQTYSAISIACVQSSGLLIIDESGQECKPINAGNAARIGVFSALLAAKGLNAPKNPIQSVKGWFNAFSNDNNQDMKINDLGKNFTIMDSYLKLYPSCRHSHSSIDAIRHLKKIIDKKNIDYKRIKIIKIFIYPNAIKSAGHIQFPKNSGEAKFSISYAVATALYTGNFTIDNLDVQHIIPEVLVLSKKIELIPDPHMECRFRGIRGSKVQIILDTGDLFEKTILIPKGEGNDPLTWNDIEQKIHICCDKLIMPYEIENIIKNVKEIKLENKFINYGINKS